MQPARAVIAALLLVSLPAVSAGSEKGPEIYRAHCQACHAPANVMVSAPKAGDAGAWKEHLAQGLEKATDNAVAGIGAMPPKGGATQLTREEIRAAIRFMAGPQP